MKLYLLTTGVADYYVLANDPSTAETRLINMLNVAEYGYTRERKVTNIQVLAEAIEDVRFLTGKNLLIASKLNN